LKNFGWKFVLACCHWERILFCNPCLDVNVSGCPNSWTSL